MAHHISKANRKFFSLAYADGYRSRALLVWQDGPAFLDNQPADNSCPLAKCRHPHKDSRLRVLQYWNPKQRVSGVKMFSKARHYRMQTRSPQAIRKIFSWRKNTAFQTGGKQLDE